MNNTVNKFVEVFKNINFSEVIIENFKSSMVTSIFFDTKKSTLKIDLLLNQIIDFNYIEILKKEIKNQLKYISEVDLNIKFDFLDLTIEEVLKKYWDNIICNINKNSPLCFKILKNSNWELNNNILNINIKNNSSFLFSKKKLNKEIEKTIFLLINENITVNFKDIEITQEEKQNYNKYIIDLENSLSKDITILDKNSNLPTEAKNFSQNKFKGGFSYLKINNELKSEIGNNLIKLSEDLEVGNEILISGTIFELELRETKSGKYLIIFDMTDGTDSVTIKFFTSPDNYTNKLKDLIKKGSSVLIKGNVQEDIFSNEINIMAKEICKFKFEEKEKRLDTNKEKRVELHLHTKMSAMDAVSSTTDLIQRAIDWGHTSIAITDHGVVQAFPEAMEMAKKNNIKIIYGMEAYLVDDLGAVVESSDGQKFNDEFIIFDLETTGLKKETDTIIEIGAIKIKNGEIIDKFSRFINPKRKLSDKIIELTNITDKMLEDAPLIDTVLFEFLDFIKNTPLVAHNANFDMGFIRQEADNFNIEINNTVLDTLELSRILLPELSRYKLNIIAKHLGVSLENHHRAVDDAKATTEIFLKFLNMLKEKGLTNLDGINLLAGEEIDKKKLRPHHAIILVKNQKGLRNLYELISKSHLEYFYRTPRIPKSELIKLREGLILGTACESGEFYKAVLDKKPKRVLKELAEFYDYLEIQPIDNNMFLFRDQTVNSVQELVNINKEIIKLGEEFNKLVVATCDVHFLEPEDDVYRKIVMYYKGFKDSDIQPPLYFRTTEEMLREFSYLGTEKAKEVVITNTNKIADMIEIIKPIPDKTFPPKIEGSDEEIQKISFERAKKIYGNPLPKIVLERLEKELKSIIKNGFSVMYIIAQKLVWKSLEDGYLVGSRGSVGSSFVATMLSITEVNPLQPHYYCPHCQETDFKSETVLKFLGGSGCDMPDKNCPKCSTLMEKDGHDIPFETFLGFDGDKEPDIDLNFSGEYQSKAHEYTEELFGEGYVFKAGTIGTVAEKTAYGFVRKYYDENNIIIRNAEINRLRTGCTGVKRTTGQHPGGLIIVPNTHSIYDFTPVQRPANDTKSNIITTHFDYHSIEGRLLKLDILGHDVPTIIRYLQDTTGIDPTKLDLGDKKIISLFNSPEALGLKEEDIDCKTGSLGLPEFGTQFVRQMLIETKPETFAELVRISGLSHGTDVWINNGQDLIKNNIASLKEIIPTRDDIMVYLINMGVENKNAFNIMEHVRKGKGLTPEQENIMLEKNIPKWYTDSCKKIKYMFPKGHAVAYVMMTVRIGYFKIYYPYSFYGGSFSVKTEDFDYEIMCQGINIVKEEIKRIKNLGRDITTKDKSSLTMLELVREMYARDLKFLPLDLYESDPKKFIVKSEGLLPPLCTIPGLGQNAAESIVEARKNKTFRTIEEFREETKISKTVLEILKKFDIFKDIPETDQLTLF